MGVETKEDIDEGLFLAALLDRVKARYPNGYHMALMVWPADRRDGALLLSDVLPQAIIAELIAMERSGGKVGRAHVERGVEMQPFTGRQVQ